MFQFSQEIDPCDPTLARNITAQQMKSQHKGDSKSQGKSKTGKGKGKGKKIVEEERPAKPVRKLWYEALSPEGYTYYWHIENNGKFIRLHFPNYSRIVNPSFSFSPFSTHPSFLTTADS